MPSTAVVSCRGIIELLGGFLITTLAKHKKPSHRWHFFTVWRVWRRGPDVFEILKELDVNCVLTIEFEGVGFRHCDLNPIGGVVCRRGLFQKRRRDEQAD